MRRPPDAERRSLEARFDYAATAIARRRGPPEALPSVRRDVVAGYRLLDAVSDHRPPWKKELDA